MEKSGVTRSGRIALMVLGIFCTSVFAFAWIERAHLHRSYIVELIVAVLFICAPFQVGKSREKFSPIADSATGLFMFALVLLVMVIGAMLPESWVTGGQMWREHGAIISGTVLTLGALWVGFGLLVQKSISKKRMEANLVR